MARKGQYASDTLTTSLLVTNIHCPSCVSYAKDVLRPISQVLTVEVSIIDHVVRVEHDGDISKTIVNTLIDAAFEVQHVDVRDGEGHRIYEAAIHGQTSHTRLWPRSITAAQRKHIANCNACQSQRTNRSLIRRMRSALWSKGNNFDRVEDLSALEKGHSLEPSSEGNLHDHRATGQAVPGRYTVELSIVGMTCASCVSAISNELRSKSIVQNININLLTNSGRVQFEGDKSDATKIVESIEDIGYEAAIVSITPDESRNDDVYKAFFSIEGMTCGSCVGTITRGLEEVPGIVSVSIDLIGESGIIQFSSLITADSIIEKIEDLGYEASLVKFDKLTTAGDQSSNEERDLSFNMSGMYCPRCPATVAQALSDQFGHKLAILHHPSLQSPVITVRYKPERPKLTARRVRDVIEASDPAITASVYHPPSLEERSRLVQRRERNRILRHLLVTLIIAVPSFIIGIVYMSLVPKSNATRQWFEQPIWNGSAMRIDWVLFILTTPAYFYGASIFHSRTLKEIWSIWKPGSKVPMARRFYRFGSMNLLISAGTSVAYFSSLAILILEGATPVPNHANMAQRHSTTYFDTVTFLTLFILVGKFLEAYSKSKTGDAVAMLGKLRPTDALLLENNGYGSGHGETWTTERVPVDLLEIGDIVTIPHGASPPVDGEIEQDGPFLFDESSLTGESKPVSKVRGETVLTGSVNVSSPANMIVKTLGTHSMLDQIINVVREGQAKRAPVERLADAITGYFTPVITLIAILTWIVWLSLGTSGTLPSDWLDVDRGSWPFWSIEFAIAVFVVACPCGIGLAAPTALFVGGGLAAKAGILVQGGGQAFQEASQVDAIVFDKTGTLTEGSMQVVETQLVSRSNNNLEQSLILKLANVLEESSTHPIAKAISEYCQRMLHDQDTPEVRSREVQEIPGRGMKGKFEIVDSSSKNVKMYEVAVGNERIANDERMNSDSKKDSSTFQVGTKEANSFLDHTVSRLQATGSSTAIVYFREVSDASKVGGVWHPLLVFAVSDPLRPEAASVLQALTEKGIDVHMCTGDNRVTAHAVASQLGIPVERVRAGVLPQEKARYIQEIQYDSQDRRRLIAFVGDGTNDTPALTAADVPIALSAGSDIAVTAASFILLNDDLTTILKLVKLAKRVFWRVKMNFVWAAIYNVCLIPVAAGVFYPIGQWRLSPVWASAAMALSSVSVVLSSLALKLPELDLNVNRIWKKKG